jgi:uncharacterized protein
MPFPLKLLLILVGSAIVVYVAVCLFLFLQQTRLIFFPSARIEMTPAAFNLPYEEVWLSVGTDKAAGQINGWWIPATRTERVNQRSLTLLYLHGNGVNIGANVAQANYFHQLEFSVLLVDYRGYGRSQGAFPGEAQVYQDAQTAWNYLVQDRKISPDQIFIYGHSLGGAIAIDLAIRHPNAAGLIVQSTFTSMRDMVDRTTPFRLFPDFLLTQRFASIQKVPDLRMPVLFIHGKADAQVPFDMSVALYAAAPEPKRLYLVPGAGHNDVTSTAGAEYLQVVQRFVQQAQADGSLPH